MSDQTDTRPRPDADNQRRQAQLFAEREGLLPPSGPARRRVFAATLGHFLTLSEQES